ncbi:precorrin-6A/cobalt-precorrin-6A reductase [Pedobacter hartonius]|uniref:Cobalt-precorrin-5B (C1)-methyltransferase n=1 Tax=Pedobacter hartonius TaxID=425514 RepID=A0A1H4EUJ9_9SPHI|nr:precorrin-6A/cobalt-precorrin-6A reductase [Pedobacter hartonius]SEA88577.1 cobalt-precorrin-5B (C1)-methyltransferase [Pedobacter hartonius]
MILLLGGTTEAKQAAGYLDEAGLGYIYSTRTEVPFEGKGKYRFGSLDAKGLKDFCRANEISHIINACHPFARELHLTVATIVAQIPVIRFEREFPARISHPLVHYISNYAEALQRIKDEGYRSMLALTGLQSIPLLENFWQQYPCWFRILDRKYSTDLAASYHFPSENLLFGLPQEKEAEIELFSRLRPEVILTKESGLNGKLDAKTDAALSCRIPIFIIKKPELSTVFQTVYQLQDLFSRIQ